MDNKTMAAQAYSLGLYEKAMPAGLPFSEMLKTTKECGFDRLEISVDESDERLERLYWTAAEQHALRDLSGQLGVPIRTMCLSGQRKYPMGSHNQATREKSMEILFRAVDFCCNVGISLIQLAGYDVYYETGDAETKQYFAKNLNLAVEYAAKCGVNLGFETMETPFMDTVGKAMQYVDAVNSAWLGVYPDIGNLKNAAVLYQSDLAQDLERGNGHIFAAHLKETKPGVYRDMDFGTGHTEYQTCLVSLLRMNVRMFTGEFWYQKGQDYQKTICRSAEFLRSQIERAMGAAWI